MPKKGKGRGKGKGASGADVSGRDEEEKRPGPSDSSNLGRGRGRGASGSDVSGRDDERRPGPDSSNIGRGRGRGSSGSDAPGRHKGQPGTSESSNIGRDRVPTSEARPFEQPRMLDVPQTSGHLPPFFSREGDSIKTGTSTSAQAEVRKKKFEKVDIEELSKLTSLSLEHKEPTKLPVAKRPNHAVIDNRNRISLFVNYFKLSYKDAVIYHYDIDISDSTKEKKIGSSLMSKERTLKEDIKQKVKFVEREKRRNIGKNKCRDILSKVFKSHDALKKFCPVYDGQKNLFTSQPLPCKKETPYPVDISIEGKEKRYFVTITPVEKKDKTNVISLEPLKELYTGRSKEIPYEVLLVYETVMSHREPPFEQVHFRNTFFNIKGRDKTDLGYGLEIWRGYHQSIQLTELGPVVVINLAAKAFHKSGSVIDYACDILNTDITRTPKLANYQIKNLSDALRGIQVKVTHQKHPRKYKIKSVTDHAAKDIPLEIDRKRMSVAQYFLDKYKKKLNYPHLPCLLMQTSSTTHMPMETCEIIEGQPKVGKLSGDLTSKMIQRTAVDPKTRKGIVSETAVDVKNKSKRYMDSFGLLMDITLMQVDGRIMPAPQLAYDKSVITKPDKRGVWRVEGGMKFFKVVRIENWVLISFADERRFGREVLDNYCRLLVQSGRKCGMVIDRPQSINIYGRNDSTESALIKAKKSGAQMAIVVLNRRDERHTYDEVKFLADFKYNLVTQCMEDKTLGRINDQITTNVCLKINVKLGGINHILHQRPQVFTKPVIVLGIDAIHWTRGFGYPSILSVVGSLNATASRYALLCDLQRNDRDGKISQEIIRNTKMKDISKVILNKFREANNGRDPVKIIVFRDGVSEGQFQHALDHEVSGLQDACREMYNNQILPITYIIVQKRHQTRLFPARPADGVGKHQNVPPGTCVDKDITHPVYFDYFICSHEGIQGTSKPAHYNVLHDDNKFHCEELQQLCYFLCHTYVRCTRSVSLPAPVMYADLAAARAKKYADLHVTFDNASTVGSDSSAQRDLPRDVERAIREMQSFDNNMFYV